MTSRRPRNISGIRVTLAVALFLLYSLCAVGQYRDDQPQGVASEQKADSILVRGSNGFACSSCNDPDSVACAISPLACQYCWDNCSEEGQSRRVSPSGPTRDPWLHGGYVLDKSIGVMQLAHEYYWEGGPQWLTYLGEGTNLDLAREVRSYGFRTLKVWMTRHPFDGIGEPFCYDLFDTGDGDWWCETDTVDWVCDPVCRYTTDQRFEDMVSFWARAPVDQIFVRFERWMLDESRPDGSDCDWLNRAPYYEVAKKLYELIGWRDITIVFTDWEQDWGVVGCGTVDGGMPDMSTWINVEPCQEDETEAECRSRHVDIRLAFVLSVIEERQEDIERARKEAWLELGHAPKLRILHSVVLNRWPGNERPHELEADLPKLAEHIKDLKRSPDLLGISYWKQGEDPIPILDWFAEVTGYPRTRFYIDEFGAKQSRQVDRFTAYLPAFWDWGIRTINIWMWKQNWCDYSDLGLFEVHQPCVGRVIHTGAAPGLDTLLSLQCEADGGRDCWGGSKAKYVEPSGW